MLRCILIFTLLLGTLCAQAQDTFSIVAVDSISGEIGSAGASCLDNIQFPGSNGAILISDIIPGRGAIHTQASWNATNQQNAHNRMVEGLSPEEIVAWLKTNDSNGIFGFLSRQYGVVDFDSMGHPRAASLTGSSCLDWKGHKTGVYYSIQGNILLGPEILDSMEARFLATEGPLADRLMAALQGANVPGADTRCLSNGTSSLSAFLRVAKPDDNPDSLYLDLNVPSLPAGQEPIDSLQTLYNAWKTTAVSSPNQATMRIFPNPASGQFFINSPDNGRTEIYDLNGQRVFQASVHEGINNFTPVVPKGMYFIRLTAQNNSISIQKLIWY
ncbi:MAG: DUF1028 domain-containing protein [Lewinellaceae bacterium]|nr:DUF1028 domain-containing protein [Lewinellaceae bacterium]